MKSEKELYESLIKYGVPEHLHEGLVAYLLRHRPTGGFLHSVLENDFGGAVARADHYSYSRLKELHWWIEMMLPSNCHGSAEKVATWLAEFDAKAYTEEQLAKQHDKQKESAANAMESWKEGGE